MTEEELREKYIGKPIFDVLLPRRHKEGQVILMLNDYGRLEHSRQTIDMLLVGEVVDAMQRYGVQEKVSFNANMHNPVCVHLDEFCLGRQGRGNGTGDQQKCLLYLCRMINQRPKLAVWVNFEPFRYEVDPDYRPGFALNHRGTITDVHTSDGG